jgi:hypothetical protein
MILIGSPQAYESTPQSYFVYGRCVPCSGKKRIEKKRGVETGSCGISYECLHRKFAFLCQLQFVKLEILPRIHLLYPVFS